MAMTRNDMTMLAEAIRPIVGQFDDVLFHMSATSDDSQSVADLKVAFQLAIESFCKRSNPRFDADYFWRYVADDAATKPRKQRKRQQYLIAGQDNDELSFWSNEHGWTSLSEATRFDDTDYNLPTGGRWVTA